MDHLSANLSALEAIAGSEVRLPEANGRVLLDTTGPAPVLHLSTTGGSVALNSRRDPLAEAGKILEAALAGRPEPSVIVVVGLGLGYIIDAIEQRCPAAKILALEPCDACVPSLLQRRDLTALLSSRRLTLLWGPDYRGAADAWRLVAGDDTARFTVRHPVLCRAEPTAFAAAAALVERILFEARANEEAKREFAGRYLLNTLDNLSVVLGERDVAELRGVAAGSPAILVGAGPSIDDNLREMAGARERAVIIATDTSARPLLAAGIEPHFVVSLEASPANARHLNALPGTPSTVLVGEASLDPAAFRPFRGRSFVFRVADNLPWPWLQRHGVDLGILRAWGSVLTSAFDLAIRLDCDPIVFAGADLSYSNGRPYCSGTTFEARDVPSDKHVPLPDPWLAMRERARISVEGIDGRPVETARHFVAFRDWLASAMEAEPRRRFSNVTGHGILRAANCSGARLSDLLGTWPPLRPLPVHTAAPTRPTVSIIPTASDAWRPIDRTVERLLSGQPPARVSEVKGALRYIGLDLRHRGPATAEGAAWREVGGWLAPLWSVASEIEMGWLTREVMATIPGFEQVLEDLARALFHGSHAGIAPLSTAATWLWFGPCHAYAWPGSEECVERARRLFAAEAHPEPRARLTWACLEASRGKWDEALEVAAPLLNDPARRQEVRGQLLGQYLQGAQGRALARGRYRLLEEEARLIRRECDPIAAVAAYAAAVAEALTGRIEEAAALGSDAAFNAARSPIEAGLLVLELWLVGGEEEARRVLESVPPGRCGDEATAFCLACAHALVGSPASASDLFEQASKNRAMLTPFYPSNGRWFYYAAAARALGVLDEAARVSAVGTRHDPQWLCRARHAPATVTRVAAPARLPRFAVTWPLEPEASEGGDSTSVGG